MTDQTPDFDSMSPEELMAWMESLAKRQGADEGFTTAADMALPEVDPSTVQVEEPGYIPYGMDAATWQAKQEAEAKRKAERRAAAASAPPPQPAPTPAPPASAPVVPAAAAPAPAAASAQPDFDSMTPEQLMAWMESLAKRQGADAEQFTTSADMEVPEIDASSVQLEEPGYIPYGMDADTWAVKQAAEERRKEERRAAAATAPSAPAPRPTAPPPAPVQQPPAAAVPPPPPQPQLDLFSMDELTEDESTRMTPAEENPLAWLESLAADGGSSSAGTGIPELDLSGLDQPLVPDLSAVSGGQDDPMAWLESLSQGQNAIPGLEQFSLDEVAAPPTPAAAAPPPIATPVPAAPASDNPLEWLESLARRQGADSEELTTSASLDIPTPDARLINKGPGYTEYTFESDHAGDDTDALSFLETVDEDVFEVDTFADETEDTSDWLTALASGEVPDSMHHTAASTEDIQSALAQGADIPPDAMKDWMDQMLEQGAARNDVPDYVDEEEDEQIAPAKLPDWLIEQVGAPPEVSASATNLPSTAALVDQIVEPPAVDMPDWLREDIADGESAEMEDIFAFEDEPLPPAPPAPVPVAVPSKIDTSELQMDTSDPWVEAFEVERKLGDESVPSWYAKKLASLGHEVPEGQVVGGDLSSASGVALMSAALPDESELVAAVSLPVPDWLDVNVAAPATPSRRPAPPVVEEPITASVPDWLRDQMPAEQADVFSADLFLETEEEAEPVAEAGSGDLPDWLREAGLGTEDEIEIPAWLTETLETNETPAVAAAPSPEPAPAAPAPRPAPAVAPVPAAVSPAPIVPAVANINVGEMLNTARSTFQAGQFEESVQAYETVIRANTGLDAVVEDLSGYIKNEAHKSNPALYRVLGDGLMRQGKLQQALDTYRKALNLL